MEPAINVTLPSSNIFSGKEIGVVQKSIPPPVHTDKEILDNIIVKHGGTITFNPGRNNYCVVANIVTFFTKSYSKRMKLILATWIYKCVAAKECLPFESEDYFFIVETVSSSKPKIIPSISELFLLQEV
uniref:BRCT domain-containing protein n=1 Tax=Daphnia galeata TaxID=27404 RepID=A0A8J2W5C7_9CRUS|nr:unnamed protein product [Daphnia galeata]